MAWNGETTCEVSLASCPSLVIYWMSYTDSPDIEEQAHGLLVLRHGRGVIQVDLQYRFSCDIDDGSVL